MTTVRTIKLKRNSQGGLETTSLNSSAPDQASVSPAEEASTQAATTDGSATSPLSAGLPDVQGASVSGRSYLPYMIAAAVVVVVFLVIMGLQYSEMSLYQADPSVWVRK